MYNKSSTIFSANAKTAVKTNNVSKAATNKKSTSNTKLILLLLLTGVIILVKSVDT